VENDAWEREENLGHAKDLVDEFEGRLGAEVRRQERIEQKWKMKSNSRVEKFKRMKLLGKYIARMLYRWDDGKFEEEYLKKLERN